MGPHPEVHLLIQAHELGEHALLAVQKSRDSVGPAKASSVVFACLDRRRGGGAVGSTLGRRLDVLRGQAKKLTVVLTALLGTSRISVVVILRLFTVTLKAKATGRQIVSEQEEQVRCTSTSERTDEQEMNEVEHVEVARAKREKRKCSQGKKTCQR